MPSTMDNLEFKVIDLDARISGIVSNLEDLVSTVAALERRVRAIQTHLDERP